MKKLQTSPTPSSVEVSRPKELKVIFKNPVNPVNPEKPQNRLRMRLKTVDSMTDVTVTTSSDASLPPEIRIAENEDNHNLEPMDIDEDLNMAIEKAKLMNAGSSELNLSEEIFAKIDSALEAIHTGNVVPEKVEPVEDKSCSAWLNRLEKSPSPTLVLEKLEISFSSPNETSKTPEESPKLQPKSSSASDKSPVTEGRSGVVLMRSSSILKDLMENPPVDVTGNVTVDEKPCKKRKLSTSCPDEPRKLQLTQAELREIEEIAEMQMTSSEEEEKDEIVAVKKEKIDTEPAGNIAMLMLQSIEKNSVGKGDGDLVGKVAVKVAKSTCNLEAEVSMQEEQTHLKSLTSDESMKSVEGAAVDSRVSKELFSEDDFEPDYEPEDD